MSIHHSKSIREKRPPDVEIRRTQFARMEGETARENQKLPSRKEKEEIYTSEIWRTAVPSNLPARNFSSAVLASSSGKIWVFVFTGTRGAISRNSLPSRRVKFATEQIARSFQRSTYGNEGMSLM